MAISLENTASKFAPHQFEERRISLQATDFFGDPGGHCDHQKWQENSPLRLMIFRIDLDTIDILRGFPIPMVETRYVYYMYIYILYTFKKYATYRIT
jgi:hypothetical protein